MQESRLHGFGMADLCPSTRTFCKSEGECSNANVSAQDTTERPRCDPALSPRATPLFLKCHNFNTGLRVMLITVTNDNSLKRDIRQPAFRVAPWFASEHSTCALDEYSIAWNQSLQYGCKQPNGLLRACQRAARA